MKLLVMVSLVGACAGGALRPAYLPPAPHSAPSYYSGAGSESVRPRAALERGAAILRLESSASEGGFRYAYETEDGARAEESGVERDGVQARGGYSYTGDDGQVYSVTYEAGDGGFRAAGAHLPTPPPIPDAILRGLEENARDEAAGVFDDGSYKEAKYGGGPQHAGGALAARAHGNFAHRGTAFGQRAAVAAAPSREYLAPNPSRPGYRY